MSSSNAGGPRIKIRCPNCRKDGGARAELTNRRVTCKHCAHVFRARPVDAEPADAEQVEALRAELDRALDLARDAEARRLAEESARIEAEAGRAEARLEAEAARGDRDAALRKLGALRTLLDDALRGRADRGSDPDATVLADPTEHEIPALEAGPPTILDLAAFVPHPRPEGAKPDARPSGPGPIDGR